MLRKIAIVQWSIASGTHLSGKSTVFVSVASFVGGRRKVSFVVVGEAAAPVYTLTCTSPDDTA